MNLFCARKLKLKDRELRDVVVSFDHDADVRRETYGMGIEIPDLVPDGLIMGVDHDVSLVGVAGEMKLRDLLPGNVFEVNSWIETVVSRANVDVVDVEQKPTARADHDLAQKLGFCHFTFLELYVRRDVLDHQRPSKAILYGLNSRDDMIYGFASVGKG